MGIKLDPKNETSGRSFLDYYENNKYINLTHWRAIRETKHEGVNGVFVIAKNFKMYFIPRFTTDEFHKANYYNKTLDIYFEYIKNVFPCYHCLGDGKTDWVESVMGKEPRRYRYDKTKFNRSKRGPVFLMTAHTPPYFVSTVVLNKGEEYCKYCSGSGLEFASKNRHTMNEKIFLEHS